MFRYRLHLEDGSDAGEATYAQMIKPGEEIIAGNNLRFRVVDFVPFEEEGRVAFRGAATGRDGLEVLGSTVLPRGWEEPELRPARHAEGRGFESYHPL